MRVLAYDKFTSKEVKAKYVSLEELYSESDIISLHCPLTNENNHMICTESIEK